MSSSTIEKPLLQKDVFKLPIEFNAKKQAVKENIIADLELIRTLPGTTTTDASGETAGLGMYYHAFQTPNRPLSCFSDKTIERLPTWYTTDTTFLKDTQTLLKTYKDPSNESHSVYLDNSRKVSTLWNEINNDTGFKERYMYLDWECFQHLNYSETFLQIMSIYNMASPVLSLLIPLFLLVVPFFILQLKGLAVSFSEYTKILYQIAQHHSLGRVFTDFHNVSFQQKTYLIASAGFYLFSIYQNILICLRFRNNMKKIHDDLDIMRTFTRYTIVRMNTFLKTTRSKELATYEPFCHDVTVMESKLLAYLQQLDKITPFSYHPRKIYQFGHILKTFYELHDFREVNDAYSYAFSFHGYLDTIVGLQDNIQQGHLHFATFVKKPRKNKIKGAYYPGIREGDTPAVKNDIPLHKNMIITGPNASGKTTLLKTALINILLSQQWGVGFYRSAKLYPYDHIHCYLNIPDTSGRDSLYQAEARRCKEIMDAVDANKASDTHFCIFDELFSGTNPEEAVMGATAYMKYIIANKNMNAMLTTHFLDVCYNLKTHPRIDNYKMNTEPTHDQDVFQCTFALEKGISTVKGGFKVLRDMNYPLEILKSTTG